MHDRIINRLREVYPSGDVEAPEPAALAGNDHLIPLAARLEGVSAAHGMRCESDALTGPRSCTWRFAFTEADGPSQRDWCGIRRVFGKEEKLAWIAGNGRYFPILWLAVSRIVPTRWMYYNLWKPRGDSGYLDIEIAQEHATPGWKSLHDALRTALDASDIPHLAEDAMRENCLDLFEEVFEDEQGVDSPDEVPPRRVPVSLHSALFPIGD
ncbi:hypothetical protein [Rhodanobacter ginsenosidimutans]|uniref:DUF402 domain-containing protein n=1 Tax=Rhodanobacter ginsenosidimutans TaxID=490571 RepID=A0ABW0JWP8_9GAMM